MGVQQPTPDELLNIYYFLKLTRGLEQRVITLYRQGKIVGGVYLGTGEEAIAVGSAVALEPDDVIAPTHRDLGANLRDFKGCVSTTGGSGVHRIHAW